MCIISFKPVLAMYLYVVCCVMVRCGVVSWCGGVVQCDVVQCGVLWCGVVVRCGVV